MHEGGIAHRLLDEALALAHGRPLRRIVLSVGTLADTTADILLTHMEAALLEHGVEGVEVLVVQETALGRCGCGQLFEMVRPRTPCPACGSVTRIHVVSGKACRLNTLDYAAG